eukprot:15340006-Ditylum_brightwellii.AAC.1
MICWGEGSLDDTSKNALPLVAGIINHLVVCMPEEEQLHRMERWCVSFGLTPNIAQKCLKDVVWREGGREKEIDLLVDEFKYKKNGCSRLEKKMICIIIVFNRVIKMTGYCYPDEDEFDSGPVRLSRKYAV